MEHLVIETVHTLPISPLFKENEREFCKICRKPNCRDAPCNPIKKNEITFEPFINYITAFPHLPDYKNIYFTMEKTNKTKTLNLYDTSKKKIIYKYAYSIGQNSKVLSYHIFGNLLLFCERSNNMFKLFTLPKYKTYIHQHDYQWRIFQTKKHLIIAIKSKFHAEIQIYDHEMNLKDTLEAEMLSVINDEVIHIYHNQQCYYDLTHNTFIDKSSNFQGTYKDMIIESDCKQTFLKNFIREITILPLDKCYGCRKKYVSDCILLPCGHMQFHKVCVGKRCPMCCKTIEKIVNIT